MDRLFEIQNQHLKNEIQGLICLSIFFEALINEVAITELGKSFFEKNLDKLSPLPKWNVISKIVFDKNLDTSRHYYSHIKKVIEERNRLVHYKTSSANSKKLIEPERLKILKDGLDAVKLLLQELDEVDKEKRITKFIVSEKQLNRIKNIQ